MEDLVKLLTDIGMTKSAATKKVNELYEKVKQVRPEDPEEKIEAIVRLKISQFASAIKRSGAKAMKGICLGYSDYRDVFLGLKQAAIAEYSKDPRAALEQGIVRVEADKVIPLDTRKTLPSGDANPRYGQPIPELWRRDLFLSVENELARVFGDVKDEPKIGGVYAFAGIQRENAIALSRLKPFTLESEMKSDTLWKLSESVLAKYAVSLHDVSEWHTKHADDIGRIAALKGVIMYSTEATTGNQLMVIDDIDDPVGEGIPVFTSPTMKQPVGTEIITFGRTFQTTTPDGEARIGLNGFGVIPNPETVTAADLFREMDEILWE